MQRRNWPPYGMDTMYSARPSPAGRESQYRQVELSIKPAIRPLRVEGFSLLDALTGSLLRTATHTMRPHNLLRATALSLVAGVSLAKKCDAKITRDVVIIGGGAAGAHAAVRLREDFDKSVVVVEKRNRLVRTPKMR